MLLCLRQDGQKLFAELRNLAEEQPPKHLKEASFKIGHRMDLHRFIVPVQARQSKSLFLLLSLWMEAFFYRGWEIDCFRWSNRHKP